MSALNIYKSKGFYKIVTQSKTLDGFLLSGEPIFLIQLDDTESLGNAVFESIRHSKENIPTPQRDDYAIRQKNELKKLQEKSYTSLYKESSSCNLRFEKGVLRIYPEKFFNPEKPSDGLVWVEEDMVEIPDAMNKKEETISEIIEILNRKYR